MDRVTPKFDHLTQLAKTVAVPRLHAPMRTPTFPALERTALLAFTDTGTMPINASNGGYLDVALVRDPIYPLWITYEFPLLWSLYTAMAMPALGQGIPSNTQATFVPDPNITNLGNINIPNNITPVIQYQNLDFMPCYSSRYADLTDLSNSIAVGVEVSASTALAGFKFDVSLLAENFGELSVFNSSVSGAFSSSGGFSGSVVEFQTGVPSSRIIGIRFSELVLSAGATASNITQVLMGITTTSPAAAPGDLVRPLLDPKATTQNIGFMPWKRPPALADSNLPYRGARANAVAALFSNVGKTLDKEGTVEGARVYTGSFPVFAPYLWNFADIHPKDRYYGPLEKGAYGFTIADVASDKFKDSINTAGLTHFNMDGFQYAVCIRMVDPDTTTPSTMAVTLDRHIEFRTTSLLFATGFSTDTLELYHQAQIALLKVGCIQENPTHLATLAGLVGKAVHAAWPVLKPHAVAAGHAVVRKTAAWANKKLGAMPQASMVVPKPPPRPRIPARKPARAKARK